MKLYELNQQYRRLADLASEATSDEDLALLNEAMAGLTDDIAAKLSNCAAVVRTLEKEAEAANDEAKRLKERAGMILRSCERLEAYMRAGMETAGLTKVKGTLFTVAIQNNPPRVKVEDESVIPAAFTKQVTEIRKAEIREALMKGEYVPGASLEHTTSLRIK